MWRAFPVYDIAAHLLNVPLYQALITRFPPKPSDIQSPMAYGMSLKTAFSSAFYVLQNLWTLALPASVALLGPLRPINYCK